VIGVLLMIVACLFLAVAIGSVVLNSGQNLQDSKIVAVSASKTSSGYSFTMNGGKDLHDLVALKIVQPQYFSKYSSVIFG